MSRKDNAKWKDIIKDCTKFDIAHILEEYRNKLSQKKPQIHHLARVVYSDYLILTKSTNWRSNCFTCNKRLRWSDWETQPGHFRKQWWCLKHKFNDDNVEIQCRACNCALDWNYQIYTIKMIKKRWLERVEDILQDKGILVIKNYEYAEKILLRYNILQRKKTLLITPIPHQEKPLSHTI